MYLDFSHVLTEPLTLALTCLLAASLLALALYYGLCYMRVGRYTTPKNTQEGEENALPPVSVVMVAQNDGEWLRANLVYLLEQDYPDFEVVVVDYLSTDDTKFVLQLLSENYRHLKVVRLEQNVSGYEGKKYPLSIGIKSAKNDILLMADPECVPQDKEGFGWIRAMVAGYWHEHIDIVLGYSGITDKKSLLGWLQQYDNMDYSTEYLAAAMMHRPFSGNGRNLSYRRCLFMEHNGFIYHYHEPDGADDMFVNQNARKHNTAVVLSPESFTTTDPQPTLALWRKYRKHRTATHRYYSSALAATRLVRPLAVLTFYAAGAILLALGTMPWEVLALVLAMKLAWQIVATAQACKRLKVTAVVYALAPLWEIYFLFSNTILKISPLSKKN